MSELKTTPGGLVLLGGRLCLDFCNTVSERHTAPHDFLAQGQYATLIYWCAEVDLITPLMAEACTAWQADHPATAHSLYERAVELREAIYQVALAAITGQTADLLPLNILNGWIQQTMLARKLAAAGDGKFAWEWRDTTTPELPLWLITLSAVEVLLDADLTRLRQCPGCGWLFYDQSKNNSRTWCDMRYCGNRAKNKRFHARQKQTSD